MEWSCLKKETKELIANSIGIYYDLKERNNTYRSDSVAALSLYTGVLRMGQNTKIYVNKSIRKPYVKGETYFNGYYIDNIVCQLLNKHNIDINGVVDILDLNKKYLDPTCSSKKHKIESQYMKLYSKYLKLIRAYYIKSLRIEKNMDKTYCPEIDMSIPNIIVALYYQNIDPNLSVPNLISKIKNEPTIETTLNELQEHSLIGYLHPRPLIMNKSLGKVI